jgi:glucokinase
MILGSRLYSGTNGNAGEIGHIRLADGGPVGYGKAGSFEGFCSGGGIAKLAKAICRDALKRGDPISFAKNEGEIEAINTKMLADLAHSGDADAKRIFDISAEKLGEGLSIVIDIINPERIVIGGVYSRAADLFASGMRAALEREALAPSLSVCEIVPAELGEEIGDIAALSAAILAVEG